MLYGNEAEIGSAIRDAIAAGDVTRKELWITSKLWCNAHCKENVAPALEKSKTDFVKERGAPDLLNTPIIRAIAEATSRTPAQVLLAWHIQRGQSALAKSVNQARLRENLAATEVELSPEQLKQIESLDSGTRLIAGAFWVVEGGPWTLQTSQPSSKTLSRRMARERTSLRRRGRPGVVYDVFAVPGVGCERTCVAHEVDAGLGNLRGEASLQPPPARGGWRLDLVGRLVDS